MAKEIYLYEGIYSWSAERFMKALEDHIDEEIVARVNSGGGSVFDGYGIITKMQEHPKGVTVKVDGLAASMAFFMLIFAKRVITNDVSEFMVHRASGYASTQEQKDVLKRMNKSMRAKMEAKLDMEKFTKITGKTMNDIFDAEERVDVWLTAKQAKAVGIVDEIIPLAAAEAESYKSMVATLAERKASLIEENEQKNKSNINNKKRAMTKAQFLAEHPAVYAEIMAEGEGKGVKKELARVNAAMVFAEADLPAVKSIIAKGEDITTAEALELQMKLMKAEFLTGAEAGAEGALPTSKDEAGKLAEAKAKKLAEEGKKTEKEIALAKFEAELDEELGITKTEGND